MATITKHIGLWWTRVRRRAIQLLTPGRSRKVKGRMFEGTPAMGGKLLMFVPVDQSLGRFVYEVRSQRGDMVLGTVRWSNQWGRAKFVPHPEAVFDQQCLAEIYAAMKEFK